ncbi:glypican-5-like [Argiope bruennichi]|uniref:glypican-5-like n=1 Tax=Argiope bruennichi TaxID=94029 RepID=UPI002494798F|nr:glypican-5-like [Argiope bruennichi]
MARFFSFVVVCLVYGLLVSCIAADARATENTPSVSDDLSEHIGNNSCEDVRKVFVEKNVGSEKDTSDMTHEDETPQCSNSWNTSCCTPTMERRYFEASKKEFQNMLQSSNQFLQSILASSATKFKENFLDMIHVSQNNTNVLFSEVYKKMDGVAREPVSQLYQDLSSYIEGRTQDLETHISTFFDALFPLVYHHSINPKLKDFSDDYKECLRQTRREIRPFGDIADRATQQLTRSFSVARTLLDAFEIGVEVVSATSSMRFRPDCDAGLMKMVYCSHCSGFARTKPCGGYCLNVVRGCLAHVAELDQPWSDFVSGLERLTSGLVASYNIEEVLSVLDTKISEAIMYAMENGPELSKKVKTACGHPRRAARDVSEPEPLPSGTAPGRIVSVRSSEDSLYVRLQQTVQRLTETKGHYANLADTVCSDETWAVREEGQCWNGKSLGQYTHTIAGVGVAAQKYNPEMKAPDTDEVVVMGLDEKLQKMSRLLRLSILPELPQSDSYVAEGSGSGIWRNQVGDDEDYDKGSGSGDWGGSKPSDFNFDSGDSSNVNIKVKDNSAISFTSNSALILVVLLVTLLPRITVLQPL